MKQRWNNIVFVKTGALTILASCTLLRARERDRTTLRYFVKCVCMCIAECSGSAAQRMNAVAQTHWLFRFECGHIRIAGRDGNAKWNKLLTILWTYLTFYLSSRCLLLLLLFLRQRVEQDRKRVAIAALLLSVIHLKTEICQHWKTIEQCGGCWCSRRICSVVRSIRFNIRKTIF